MPIDRSTLPKTTAPIDSSSVSGVDVQQRARSGPSGSSEPSGQAGSSRAPSGPLALLRTRAPEAHASSRRRQRDTEGSGSDNVRLPPELRPIARGPRAQRALLRQFEGMSLREGTSRLSPRDAADARSQSNDPTASSRQSERGEDAQDDDFLVLADSALSGTPNFWSGGTRRAERLQVLSEWAALSSIPADAHALALGAEELRKQAQSGHPITFATDFSGALRAFHVHEELPKTIFKCEDASRAWQSAADQYHAAVDLAGKVGVSAADVAQLGEAAAHCDAQAARLAIKASLLTAIVQFKRSRYPFAAGHPRALEAVLRPLRTALEHCEGETVRALPLDAAPIAAFDGELRAIAEAFGQVSAAAPPPGAASASNRKNAVSELEYVLSALPLVLRGEPNVPALLATLRAALEAPMAEASGLLIAARARDTDPSRSLDSLTDTFESWYQTARAYDDALRTFNDTTASWPEAARSSPDARQLFAEFGESRHTAVRRMNDGLVDLFSEMCAGTLDPDDKHADPSAGSTAVTPAEILIGSDLLWRCQTLRAKLEASPFLRDASDIDAVRLPAPFAALEQYVEAMLNREADLFDAANRVRKAALTAENAAPAYGRALGPALRQFASACTRQRMKLLNDAFQEAHVAAVELCAQESSAMGPALNCMYQLRQSLPLVRFGASPEDRAAAREAQTANDTLIASMREAVQRIDAHLAQMPSPPPDASELIHDNHANLRLNLNAVTVVLSAIAELVECCDEAHRALHDGATADCTAKLRLLAESVRRVSSRVSEMPPSARSKRLTRGKTGERAQRTLQFTRRVARTAKGVQYTLSVLADLSQGYRKIADLCREPTLDPLRFHQIAEQLSDDVERAAKDIDATRDQLIQDVGTRHPSKEAAETATHDMEQIVSCMERLEWRYIADFDRGKRQWLRATVRALAARLETPASTVPPGAELVLNLIDQHLAGGTKILKITASRLHDIEKNGIADAFRENNDIRLEVQACREQMKLLPAPARTGPTQHLASRSQPTAGATTSRGDSRGKKASGKAKRR